MYRGQLRFDLVPQGRHKRRAFVLLPRVLFFDTSHGAGERAFASIGWMRVQAIQCSTSLDNASLFQSNRPRIYN